MHLVVIHGMQTIEKEEDLEDQVLEDTHLQLLLKDQEDLVMLEVFHHQKEIMVEREPTLITGVEVVAVALLLTDLTDQDIQEQPEELERQTQLQDQMYLMLVAEVLVQTEVTQVLPLDQEELVVAETALQENLVL
jgi:hypothetical protein